MHIDNVIFLILSKNAYTKFSEGPKTLLNSTKPIAEIADMLGYGDAFYFSRIFKKEEGMSPSQYRKIRRGTDASKTALADKFSPLSVLEHTKHEND